MTPEQLGFIIGISAIPAVLILITVLIARRFSKNKLVWLVTALVTIFFVFAYWSEGLTEVFIVIALGVLGILYIYKKPKQKDNKTN